MSYVIFCNDNPEFSTNKSKEIAQEILERLKAGHKATTLLNDPRITEYEYDIIYFWHIHEVESDDGI